uniref:Uncharacterized protein n=1 Tax=Macrostomum lignano TaxID=282301 RepID=A0A1I8FCN7_9PLAT
MEMTLWAIYSAKEFGLISWKPSGFSIAWRSWATSAAQLGLAFLHSQASLRPSRPRCQGAALPHLQCDRRRSVRSDGAGLSLLGWSGS